MAVCKSCGAEIVWVKVKSGKMMPCDAKQVRFIANENGGSIIVASNGAVVKGILLSGNVKGVKEEKGYVSHFATCPNANNHRKK